MRKDFIILILLFIGFVDGQAADGNCGKKKMPQEVSVMKHDSLRLRKITDLAEQSVNNLDEYTLYLTELLREAELQKDKRYIAKAYLLHIYLSYNRQDSEMVGQWMNKLEPLARREGYYSFLFNAQQCAIETLILKQEFELAEQKTEQMLAEVRRMNHIDGMVAGYKCLANVYRSTYRFEKSAEELEKAYKLVPKMSDQQSKLELITYLISIYRYMADYPNWLKYLKVKEKNIKKLIAENKGKEDTYRGNLMMTYLSYLEYYVQMEEKEKAGYYKQLVEENVCDEYVVYRFNYFKGLADFYSLMEQWEKALECKSKQCEILKTLSYRDYPFTLSDKAEILYRMGREKEALEMAKEVLRIKDTVQVEIFSKQIEQIKSDYDTNQELLKQARINRYFQYSVLGVIIILIIVLSYFAYRYNYIKKNLAKSEKEIRRVAQEDRKAAVAKERFLSNMSYAIRTPLNAVVNRSLLLASKQKFSEDERAEIAKGILDTSSDLMKLVEEILDLSRLESGRMKFSVSDINVNALIRDVAGAYPVSEVEFITSVPESENYWIHIDGMRLMQVFNSLLSDREEGKKVSVELEEKAGDTMWIRICPTALASSGLSQDAIIRNEINRMIIEYFGGSYKITPDTICFSLRRVYPEL